MQRKIVSSLIVASSLVFSAEMACASLTAVETLNQFNLVVLGNANSSSHVDGRSYVGGDLTGGDYVQHPGDTPNSSYAGLTVRGTASGVHVNSLGAVIGKNLDSSTINSGSAVVFGTASNTNFNGQAYVASKGSGNNFNGGDGGNSSFLATGTAAMAATSTDFKSVLTGLSNQLKSLTSTGGTIGFSGNKAVFNAKTDANGTAVFNLSGFDARLFTEGEFEFNLNGATTVIINSGATDIDIAANFINGGAQNIGAKTIWNFYNATDVDIKNQFGGSVLAPLADFSNTGNIEGGVFVNSLDQKAEIHLQSFAGKIPPSAPVPIPPAMLLFGSGLTGLAMMRSRRCKC